MPNSYLPRLMANDSPYDSIPTRYSLLRRLKDWGDDSGWQEFFETYWALLYNTARRAGLDDTEAQEAVQETVIAVAKTLPKFKADPGRGSFSAWLLQLTRWRIADQFRKRARARATECPLAGDQAAGGGSFFPGDGTASTDLLNRLPDPTALPLEAIWSEEWERNVQATALERVKSQVSARQYQMFDLHKLQNLSATDTARSLNVSVASVYMAAHRVARLLKKTARKLWEELK